MKLAAQMDLELLDAKSVSQRLRDLIENHHEIQIAVAWGYNGPLADCLLRNSHKFVSVTFGLAFCQTDPDLVARLVGMKHAFVANGGSATFHPKIYYFASGDQAEAIIGSANFTAGGLNKNWEACIHAKGTVNSSIFKQIRDCLAGYEGLRMPVTVELANSYRLQFDAAKLLGKPRHPVLPSGGKSWRQMTSTLATMSWVDYVTAIQSSKYHKPAERLSLLRACQAMFASEGTFSALSTAQWRAIAGVISESQKHGAPPPNHDWAWFGSMRGMGDFVNRITERDKWLARAIDSIPRNGEVTKTHYETFCRHFLMAFKNSSRTGGVPTATRLLAMKRPDSFICVSKPNKLGIASALAFARTTLDLDNYWDRVIEPIRISPWYNAPRPSGKDAELWDGRVAMLDAIYYDPD